MKFKCKGKWCSLSCVLEVEGDIERSPEPCPLMYAGVEWSAVERSSTPSVPSDYVDIPRVDDWD